MAQEYSTPLSSDQASVRVITLSRRATYQRMAFEVMMRGSGQETRAILLMVGGDDGSFQRAQNRGRASS